MKKTFKMGLALALCLSMILGCSALAEAPADILEAATFIAGPVTDQLDAVVEIPAETPVADVLEAASVVIEGPSAAEPEAAPVVATETLGVQEVLTAETNAEVLANSVTGGDNSIEGFVYRLYQTVLHRAPDAGGLQYWATRLKNGELTAAEAVNGFFKSKEYLNSGKEYEEIVSDCYYTLLNRAPDEDGFWYWASHLYVNMTIDSILQGFVESPEFTKLADNYGLNRGEIELTNPLDFNYERTAFVYRMYWDCLGREPDLAGQTVWVENLGWGMTGTEIANGFFFSDEFNKYRLNNYEFVARLYWTMLDREYDDAGLEYWANKLNYTDTREKVLNGFLGSTEFAALCRRAEIEVGDGIETPDDSYEWQYNIETLRLVNYYRAMYGLDNLYTREDLLWDLGMLRANESVQVFGHTRPNGTRWYTAFTEQGFYGSLGENLAAGQETPAEAVESWWNSDGHRGNILSDDYVYMATGYVYEPGAYTYAAEGKYAGQYVDFTHYWAQVFCQYGDSIN